MSSSQWYKALLDQDILRDPITKESKLSRIEMKLPEVSWSRTWGNMNIGGLNSEIISFLMKLIYNILPTNSRLHRMNILDSPFCTLCNFDVESDLKHALLECDFNGASNDWILAVLFDIQPQILEANLTSRDILS